jgi:sialic acid synthase SpsE
VITADVLTFKRPATGISPRELASIVGARTRVPILADEPLDWRMLERSPHSPA